MEQIDRERALIKFRNGTHQIIIATDLAARGLDIPELNYIIHYQLPLKAEEFTHRNGRTARMNAEGTSYVIQWEGERLPDFIKFDDTVTPKGTVKTLGTEWVRYLFLVVEKIKSLKVMLQVCCLNNVILKNQKLVL